MGSAAWDDNQVTLVDDNLLTAGDLRCTPFSRFNFFRTLECASERERGRTIQHVIHVVRRIVDLAIGSSRVFLVLDSDTQFHSFATNQIFSFVRRL